jgi:hypothetical protein
MIGPRGRTACTEFECLGMFRWIDRKLGEQESISDAGYCEREVFKGTVGVVVAVVRVGRCAELAKVGQLAP